jgi:hypothetical protein
MRFTSQPKTSQSIAARYKWMDLLSSISKKKIDACLICSKRYVGILGERIRKRVICFKIRKIGVVGIYRRFLPCEPMYGVRQVVKFDWDGGGGFTRVLYVIQKERLLSL